MRTSSAAAVPAPARIDPAEWIAGLYDQYGSLAFSLAFRIVRDRGIAEDVVQEAFLTVWRNAARFDPSRGTMRAWLCRIVRNRALDTLRGTSGRRRGDLPLGELNAIASASDVLSDVVRGEEARSIATAIGGLPDAQRQAIELAYYGGFTQTQIATMTSRPLGTVKGRTRAALRALTASLAPLHVVDPAPAGRVTG